MCVFLRGPMTWKVMPRNVWNDIVSWQTKRLNNSTKYQLHALTTIISKKKKWSLWENCQKYALKLFWNAYTWHVLDDRIFYNQKTNLHDQSPNGPKPITNNYLVWYLTFIIHVTTNNIVMWKKLPNNSDLDYFKTPILQEILRIQNLHQVEHCAFLEAIHLFQSVGCVRNKLQFRTVQQSKIMSLDAGLRLDGFPALDLWDLIVTALTETRFRVIKNGEIRARTKFVQNPHKLPLRKKSHGMIDDLNNVDFMSSNVHSSRQEALLYIFEDNEAVIKMITKGRSPTMRHVSRTRRVALGWLLDRINLDHKIQIKYIDTKTQLADILTKGNFTRDEWNHLLCLFNTSHFSSTNCLEAMSKRKQEDAGEERVTAKSMPMMNLVSRCRVRDPTVLTSTASESPEKTKSESQNVPLSSWNEQQPRTVRLVMVASSSDYSEWNIDDKVVFSRLEIWWNVGSKNGETRGWTTVQKADKFVIDDDDMDSDTARESNLSLRSRSFLHRVNDRLRKKMDHPSKDATKDSDKRSLIRWTFMSSTLEAFVFMGKDHSENLHSIKNTGKDLTLKLMFDISKKLILEQSDEIFGVSNQLGKISIKTVISGQWWRSHQSLACKGLCIFRFCVVSWKGESEPNIKDCLWTTVGLVQRFITVQNFGYNWRRTDGIRVEYFPRIHHIAALQQSPRVHDQNARSITIQRTNHLHGDVQWHLMEIQRK